tara:strand:+ start:813 stop:1262 length:450 start_codon:yes stop_codon:yes gene_type:complete
MIDKLNIINEMRQLDIKNKNFYQELTEEERKKFSTFLMVRWASSVEGSSELQQFYLIATNERLNKHFFTLSKHPELQWLCATTVSPDMGTPRHTWIAPKKKEPGASSIRKQLSELYPHMKDDDIAVLASMTTKKEIDEYHKLMGQEKKK